MNRNWHLRFALTSNCNFNCKYCNSNNELQFSELSFDEVKDILNAAYNIGISRVHWTGGEPLVSKNIISGVQFAKKIGYTEQVITTNGYLLENMAMELIYFGVSRINISLDTLNEGYFRDICSVAGLTKVLSGLHLVLKESTCCVKINMVVMRWNLKEIDAFIRYIKDLNNKYGQDRVILRLIQFFPCNPNQLHIEGQMFWKSEYVGVQEIIETIAKGHVVTKFSGHIIGDNPTMKYYLVDSVLKVGILAMFSWGYPCGQCYKMRITPTGQASCCLGDKGFSNLTGLGISEKELILRNLIDRRESVLSLQKNRIHYRPQLGEVRFGKKKDAVNLDTFYRIVNEEAE